MDYCHVCGTHADPSFELGECDECGELTCPRCGTDNHCCVRCDPDPDIPWRLDAVHNPTRTDGVSVHVDRLTGDIEVIEW